jgi:ParB-like chromosome segregation protein Spo0J
VSAPFQLFPSLDAATEAALRSSIERWGVLVPVVRDQHGAILDGHHRARIADELGVDYQTTRLVLGDDADRRAVACTLNADRRHLDPKLRRQLEAALRADGHSLRAIAGAVGVDEKQVRKDLAGADQSAPADRVIGLDGKRYPATVQAKNRPEDRRAQQALDLAAPALEAARVVDVATAERLARAEASGGADLGDEWYTPRWIFDALGLRFDLDVCAPEDRTYVATPTERFLTSVDDGLAETWDGMAWCNPPYSRPEPWVRRMIDHGNGVLLSHVPINGLWALDTWDACDALRLFQGVEFVRPSGVMQRPAYWLQIAAFGSRAADALAAMEDRIDPAVADRFRPSRLFRWAA